MRGGDAAAPILPILQAIHPTLKNEAADLNQVGGTV